MRQLLFALCLLTNSVAMAAEPPCSDAQQSPLVIREWEASVASDGVMFVLAGAYFNAMNHPIVLADASISFTDALNIQLGSESFPLIINELLPPNENTLWIEFLDPSQSEDLARIAELEHDLVKAVICTRSVMYEDRTIQTFD